MRFLNRTPLPAAMLPNAEGDDQITALFLCAITYRVEGGRMLIAPGQAPLVLHASNTPYPHDAMYDKAGVSVCVTGFAYPRQSRAKEALTVLRVGTRDISIAVQGLRVWQKSMLGGGLVPSDPQPFERMAMVWENAYGGTVLEKARIVELEGMETFVPGHESGYAANLNGKGFYTAENRAEHQPLPELEHPEQRIERWDDRPEPVCFAPYPLWGSMRSEYVWHNNDFDRTGTKKLVNRSAPRTTFDAIEAGTPIAVLGMRPGGRLLSFDVPPVPVCIALSIGGRKDRLLPTLDMIDIDAEASEVRFLYRAQVRYELIQFELRTAHIEATEAFVEA